MRVGFTFATAMFSASALAHFPLMECSKQGNEVHCQAGYSDGSAASNETIRLFSYDDVLLESQKTDERSKVIFALPSGDYYIVFDPGHESAVEVDGVEL
ncbi:hypothetical protein DU976_02750 [Vibrio navarrensis]|uniref:Uncharacterized protein n=1 Tax=Vibrio navarrensis TaxID=29495 RepID=A0AAI9CT66_9VIBR|nr:hypothetical protein [Vibrio navarrensis]EJL6394302.1 hypothetical protein [Vibrio navarrensis]EKA5634263.1 hypothetical protein [Vibrio navarrensis]ELN6931962.1 hypothetical protein [Vibrio navarrensis]